MKQYRFNGSHADFLKSGRPVAPGEVVRVKKEDEDDPLIAHGLMTVVRPSRRPAAVSGDETQQEGS